MTTYFKRFSQLALPTMLLFLLSGCDKETPIQEIDVPEHGGKEAPTPAADKLEVSNTQFDVISYKGDTLKVIVTANHGWTAIPSAE